MRSKPELKMPKLKVEFVPVTSQTRIPILTGGNIDLECGSTTNSVERQKQVDFAPTYFVTGTKIIVKKSSGIKSYDDLKGKTVVFTPGTTNERAMKAYNDEKKLGINFIPSKDHAESFLAVETGRAAAFPMDDVLLYGLRASAKNPADYDVLGPFLSDDPYGIMLRKDDPDVQEAGGRRGDQDLQERRDQQDLPQVVRVEDPAQGHQPEHADVGRAQGSDQEPQRQGRRGLRQDEVLTRRATVN